MAATAKEASLALPNASVKKMDPWWGLVLRLKHLFGVDRAIAYAVLARVIQILGSTGTVLLILRFLTPVEQGYYYTLLSLVSLQVVFELGFSFVILQMAAHECAHLTLHADGRIEGDPTAHARLASILQKTLRWYLVAAVILCVSLLPVGAYFFSRHARAAAPVAWHGPWILAVFATAFLFLLNPFFSFLEGCGQVWQVGRMHFTQALLGAAMSWGALLAHHGLYSPGMMIIGYVAVGAGFLLAWRNLLRTLLREPAHEGGVLWRTEVWPFQWKIAVTWLCSYFAIQIFTPILFAYRGPAEAGQFGVSLSITTYLSALVLTWMSTKATPFGQMIARGEFQRLRGLFFHTLWQSLGLLVAIASACELAVVALQGLLPRLAVRMASPQLFALLLLTSVSAFIVQSMAIYLRSFKREPLLAQSIVVSVSTVIFALLAAKTWGVAGVSLSYFVCTGLIGLISGIVIFRRTPHDNTDMPDTRRYKRSGITEMLRRVCRAVDFLALLTVLRARKRLPPFRELRKMSFVELGPGPMRMAVFKRFFFRQVFFIDQSDFGIPDRELRIVDLEECRCAEQIVDVCDISPAEHGLFLFADHCIEHLTPETVTGLLGSLAHHKFTACLRVPNLESSVGRRNFAADPTHRSSFDEGLRRCLNNFGFIISPWVRWYRFSMLVKLLFTHLPPMSLAEEIIVSGNFSRLV